MLAELDPVGALELMLAERVVSLAWRLKRAERMQNQVIDDMMENYITNPLPRQMHVLATQAQGVPLGDPRCLEDHLPLGRIARIDFSCNRVLERMMMCEKWIESSFNNTMNELKKYQLMRQVEQQYVEQELLEPEPGQFRLALNTAGDLITDLKKQSQFKDSAQQKGAVKIDESLPAVGI